MSWGISPESHSDLAVTAAQTKVNARNKARRSVEHLIRELSQIQEALALGNPLPIGKSRGLFPYLSDLSEVEGVIGALGEVSEWTEPNRVEPGPSEREP